MRAHVPLNSTRRRRRKEQLARRHGQRCAYCRRPFTDLKDATLDHIVPVSLWRSWSVTSLTLACHDCNHRKADRFPLSLALVLCAQSAPTVHADGPSFTPAHDAFTTPFTLAVWQLLARLAHAHQPVFTAHWTPDRDGERSTPDRPESTCHGPRVRRRSTRPDCLRAPRPVRTCTGPAGEAVRA
ncbi:HNH endonuclease [Streptomyces acidiscabies]|uniref:HNH endonuclease n=1 Tax=Streptomyces acidiscabies TaxID=42234 RepID=UPI0009A10F35|nr:HNH endonuclease [Streptomyces acidiscabies]